MKEGNHMNHLALNQNIFNKTLVFGSGPQEGTSLSPTSTFEGLKVYLNGVHVMPEFTELNEGSLIGRMTHPNAMDGMPGISGELTYELWDTSKEYLIVVRLKLDEMANGDSDPAVDILALIKRDELPSNIADSEDNFSLIAKEMILCHFDLLFEFYDSLDDLDDWTFEEDELYTLVKHHFDLKESVKLLKKELT